MTSQTLERPTRTPPYLAGLNPEQAAAVTHDGGPLIVIAGAGSGKTRVIERRVLHLINQGADPERILLLTFTKRAANEMRERLHGATPLADRIRATTYHAYAYSLIRDLRDELGFTRTPIIIDTDDSVRLLKRLAKDHIDPRYEAIEPKDLLRIHSATINRSLDLEDAILHTNRSYAARHSEIAATLNAYSDHKREQQQLDFDDLLVTLHHALTTPHIASRITSENEHLLVDEFQDTNKLQGDITWLLQPDGRVTIVGDPRQSIYAFRGAHYANMHQALERPDATIINLKRNYRSHKGILDLANSVLSGMPNASSDDRLEAASDVTGPAPSSRAFDHPHDEADAIREHIQRLLRAGRAPSDIAILARTNHHHTPLQGRLLRAGIPFKTYGGNALTNTAHVRDTIAFIRVILNPEDKLATQRVLELHAGIGPKTAYRIAETLTFNAPEELEHYASSARGAATLSLHSLANLITACWRETRTEKILRNVLAYYKPLLEAAYDKAEERYRDLESFADIAAAYDDLEQLMADLMLDTDPSQGERDTLSISSIHAAKGLEWPVVIVLSADDDNLPHTRARLEGASGIEEERRLAYVAVTRAQNELLITYSRYRSPHDAAAAKEAEEARAKRGSSSANSDRGGPSGPTPERKTERRISRFMSSISRP